MPVDTFDQTPAWWMRYQVQLPEQTRGDWRIFHQLNHIFIPAKAVNDCGKLGRPVPPIWPGCYTILQRQEMVQHEWVTQYTEDSGDDGRRKVARQEWVTWMSDAPGEIYDQVEAIEQIHRRGGRVLIGGLGLGVMVKASLESPLVERVDVLEIDGDIMQMIAPHYAADPRLRVIHTDANRWRPAKGQAWDVVWMDIWPHVTAKNLPDMIRFRRRYRERCGWYGAWCEEWCLKALQNEAGERFTPDLIEFFQKELAGTEVGCG